MYKFEPLLKQTLWGGDKIIPFKHLDTQMENVGESWEISGVENNETMRPSLPTALKRGNHSTSSYANTKMNSWAKTIILASGMSSHC